MEQNNNNNNNLPQSETSLASSKVDGGKSAPSGRGPDRRSGQGSGPRPKKSSGFNKRRWTKPVIRKVRVLRAEKFEEADNQKVGGLKIIHLGGLGEIGRNMSVIQYDDEIILIDAGISFPNDQMPGIDFILPNVGYLEGKEHMIKAMFFTHGHLDHIGALPFILNKIGNPDVYAAALTKAILIKRLDEYKDRNKPIDIIQIEAGEEIKVSDKNLARFKRAVRQLDKVIRDCKKDNPEAFAYLDGGGTLSLMSGDREIGQVGIEDTIITSENLTSKCGDW